MRCWSLIWYIICVGTISSSREIKLVPTLILQASYLGTKLKTLNYEKNLKIEIDFKI
jgi:hypothetical protein